MFRKRKGGEAAAASPPVISRRQFLRGAGIAAAATGMSCQTAPAVPTPATNAAAGSSSTQMSLKYPEVPAPPATPPSPGVFRVFTPAEARAVEALTARLMPGTPDDPGARDAGVVVYIDNLLAIDEGFAERTYREPPFAQSYEGDQPPTTGDQTYQVIWVPAAEISRYGYQSMVTPREVYRLGLAAVDAYARQSYGGAFADLPEDEQDAIVGDLLDNRATGFTMFSPEAFFHVLRRHTAEGMFSDPAYGGNRDMVGWRLIGYPGAQRAYTPEEVVTEGRPREPQSLAHLPHLYAGEHTGAEVIMPASGSEIEQHQGE